MLNIIPLVHLNNKARVFQHFLVLELQLGSSSNKLKRINYKYIWFHSIYNQFYSVLLFSLIVAIITSILAVYYIYDILQYFGKVFVKLAN